MNVHMATPEATDTPGSISLLRDVQHGERNKNSYYWPSNSRNLKNTLVIFLTMLTIKILMLQIAISVLLTMGKVCIRESLVYT